MLADTKTEITTFYKISYIYISKGLKLLNDIQSVLLKSCHLKTHCRVQKYLFNSSQL